MEVRLWIISSGRESPGTILFPIISTELTPKEMYQEMKMVSDYNTRCRNKFLRIEIGIAPEDEKRLNMESVRNLASNFA